MALSATSSLKHFQGPLLYHIPGSPFQFLITLSVIPPRVQPEPPLAQLESLSSFPAWPLWACLCCRRVTKVKQADMGKELLDRGVQAESIGSWFCTLAPSLLNLWSSRGQPCAPIIEAAASGSALTHTLCITGTSAFCISSLLLTE